MSLLRMPKFQRIGTSWESIVDFFSGRSRQQASSGRKNRRLMIDPLEERMLLTVSIGNTSDQTVSQLLGSQTTGTASNPLLSYTGTTGTQAVAVDHNGDFVVAWTGYDPLINPETGQQMNDPLTGYPMTEGNIYARYFTNEVQRITLPAQMLNTGTQLPAFSLVYGGNAVQQISFAQTYPAGTTTTGPAQGVFSLGYDLNGDGTIDPVTETTRPIQFDETQYNSADATKNPAVLMQNALRTLGGPLSDVTVTATDSHDYLVNFGDASQGKPVQTIGILNPAWTTTSSNPNWTPLITASVSIVRQPTQVGISATTGGPRIYVSPADASLTAQNIQTAFSAANWSANGMDPVTVQVTPAGVTATDPTGLLTFDITFVGNSGDTDQPQLVFGQMTDATGTSLSVLHMTNPAVPTIDSLNVTNIKILKENSPEFRVNPPEPDNPYTVGPDQYDQTDPAVAMDADGDFVITWTSVVPDSVNPGSQTDVFARRFSPAALESLPNMTISSHTPSISEGGSNTITVMLDSQPLANVTVNISKELGAAAILTADKSTLTFTPSNWNQAQTVKISSATDTNNTNETANFDFTITGYTTQVVTATQIDNQSLIVSSNSVSVPEGAYNSFTVQLASAPTANVTVNVTKQAGGDADLTIAGAPVTLTFTPSNWNTPQTVTVNDANDADTINGTAVLSLTPNAASGYATQTVNLTEIDKDLNSIMLSTKVLSVVEGSTNTFTVALSTAPTGTVAMDILKRADSSSDITASPTTLYFTPDIWNATHTAILVHGTWNTPQTVTLNAPLDTTVNNGTAYFYVYAPNDLEYGYQTVTANEIGVGQFVIGGNAQALGTQHTLTVREGATNTFTVALTGQPTSNVTVSIVKQSGGDADLTVSAPVIGTLTFTPGNWNQPQTVTINAANDVDAVNGTAVFYLIAPGYINQPVAVSEMDTTTPPNLIITPAPTPATGPVIVAVPEGGTSTITVKLPVAPPSNVELTITKEVGGDPDLTATATITFTPANYNTPQTITFHDATDADAINGAAVFFLDVPGYAIQKIFVGEVDTTSSKDFTIGYPTPPITNEIIVVPEGGTNTFTVVLNANPPADTTVNLTAEAGSDPDLTLNPISLTFTADQVGPPVVTGNWNVPQTVTATAAVDADTADGIAYFDVTAGGLVTQTITLIENDNTPMGLVVSGSLVASSTVFVPEGGSNTFTVALSAAPTANVTVTIGNQTTADGGDADLTSSTPPVLPPAPNTLTFTPANWNVAQTVTISDAEDADNTDGTRQFFVQSAGMTTQVVTAIELDNDVPAINISNSNTSVIPIEDISVLEGDTTGHTFYVSLPFKPTYNVTVNISKQPGGDAAISTNKSSLTFTPANWNTPQAVTITSANDSDPTDTTNGTANFYISAIGYSVQAVSVTQLDINASPVVLTASTVWVPEGGFELLPINLAYKPISDVTVTVAPESGSDADLTATPTTFTFTSANWYIPQTLIIYDAAGDTNGAAIFDITAATPTSEGTTTPVTTFPITNLTANEINYGSTLITSTDSMQVLEGSTSTFTVVLPNQPTSNVTVTIARQAGADPDLRAIPTTLTFTAGNWNIPQAVKILDSATPQTAYTTDGSAQFLVSATGYMSTTVTATELNHITPKVTDAYGNIPVIDNIPVQGVRPLGDAFRVNSFTPNMQYEASVSMDNDGDFVVSWTDEGQFTSFFNNIQAQRFDRDGNRIGSQFQVNAEITAPESRSYVSMSPDGHFLITWTEERSASQPDMVMAKVWNPQGQVMADSFDVALGFASTAAWDSGNNYVIAFDRINYATPPVADNNFDVDRPSITVGSIESIGVYQIRYSITTDPTTGVVTANTVTLPIFRVNSAWSDPTNTTSAGYYTDWPYYQGNNQVAIDADGDITTVYDGFGSETDYSATPLDYTINLDLWTAQQSGLSYLDAIELNQYYPYKYQNIFTLYGTQATDAELSDLNNALNLYYYNFYNSGLKITNAIDGTLLEPNGYIRGEPNGVQFSQFDAFRVVNPDGSVTMNYDSGGVQSDVVVNSLMDGHDAQYILGIDPAATGGGFTIRVSNSDTAAPGYTDVTITPTYLPDGGPVDVNATANTIQAALGGVTARLGGVSNTNTPSVQVRLITAAEITARTGTDWDMSSLGLANLNGYQFYEITLDDQAHNWTDISLTTFTPFTMKYTGGGNALPAQIAVETAPSLGTLQEYASVAETPSGNTVVAWTQSDQYTNGTTQNSTDYNSDLSELLGTSIHYRTYDESTDTAGPLATDFIETDGTRLINGGEVNQTMQYLTVSFDEPMMTTGSSSVTNPQNWALMKDGTVINGGISKIYYGLNMASQLGQWSIQDPADYSQFASFQNAPASNKYEAVIILDGNGQAAGTPALSNGNYQVVALNSLRDVAGNPLGRTGYNINGNSFNRSFTISVPSGSESIVNTTTAGAQTTSSNDPVMAEDGNGQVVASDGNGDSVAVWTSNTTGKPGIYARLYTDTWTLNGTTRQNTTVAGSEILVTSDAYASNAAVAMDGDGDFVVTWSSDKNDPSDSTTSWDVYARRYSATGQALSDVFMVNSYTPDIQRHSSVAMDAQGDFVITWQSMNQDGSGYGVYAQRYSPTGAPLGGTNEEQEISLIGRPKGTFTLHWEYAGVTANSSTITLQGLQGEAPSLVGQIQNALLSLGIQAADVTVAAITGTDIAITFQGKYAGVANLPQITLATPNLTGDAGFQVSITTQVQGVSGEVRVNDTTIGDQMDPSVSMDAQGAFVITWTGYGQAGDPPYDANIYAKQFVSNSFYEPTNTSLVTDAYTSEYQAVPLVVTTDDPANHVVPAGTADGVVSIAVDLGNGFGQFGSGALLTDRFHVITAAHVVCNAGTNQLASNNISVVFTLATGNVTIAAKMVTINPNYTGNSMTSPDIAIITLSQVAPAGVTGYSIYTGSDEVGQLVQFEGFGLSGTGATGAVLPYGTKRVGENKWEATADQLVPGWSSNILLYDFDNGLAANDALGVDLGIHDLGLGAAEADQAEGDSGGPCFLNGEIAAIVTAGISSPATDIDGTIDSSFGEIAADTNVSTYVAWINSVVSSGSGPEFLVNQITAGMQQWSSVALDAAGDFVVTWTSYGQDGGGNGAGAGVNGQNGVYARRFNADGSAGGNDFLVNTFTTNNQQHSQVAMDAAGDFVIAWESFQDRPAVGSSLPDVPNSYGIYAQRYARASQIGVSSFLGPNGQVGTEFQLNSTTDGDQRYPSVAMDATGDMIAVWSGNGVGDPTGVFMQRYNNLTDTAGPFVTSVLNSTTSGGVTTLTPIYTGGTIVNPISQFVIDFDENLNTTYGPGGTHSITNLSNWQLTQNAVAVRNGVASVQFGLNQAYTSGLSTTPSGKYEAVVTFDIDPNTAGYQALTPGQYALTISDNVQDIFGNALDGNLDGAPGGNYVFSVSIPTAAQTGPQLPPTVTPPGPPGTSTTGDTLVNSNQIGQQNQPAVACDAIGEYVVVWTTPAADGSTDIMSQRYDKYGRTVGTQTVVNTFTTGNQAQPDVAMDPLGNYVVVWAGNGADDNSGVYAQVFDTFGKATGTQFRVNQFRTNVQNSPRVAMDPNGDFVVTWTSYGQAVPSQPSVGDVYARRFNILSQPLSDEFLVNTNTSNQQNLSDVAMDSKGDFVIVWESDQQDGSSFGIYGQRYNSAGQRSGGEFQINSYTNDKQVNPSVAMDSSGDFVVAWSSFGQDGSGYGVYAQRFNAAGTRLGSEFRANQTTANFQWQPSVSMDNAGDFVITWSTFGQDNDLTKDYGIYARMYKANGTDYISTTTGSALGEFRVNATVTGDQVTPDVAMDSDGDYTVVWVGPDTNLTGVYCRVIAINTSTYTPVTTVATNGQFYGIQYVAAPDPTPTPSGPASFIVTGPTSGTFAAGQNITITWTAANFTANDVISLCLDTDKTMLNGNEKWIAIDMATANGDGSFSVDAAKFAPGKYYVAGYLYDKVSHVFTNS
ncbi:MAG: hypothetical protein ABSG67_11015, partial [Thermoguttaceae bacterium]